MVTRSTPAGKRGLECRSATSCRVLTCLADGIADAEHVEKVEELAQALAEVDEATPQARRVNVVERGLGLCINV